MSSKKITKEARRGTTQDVTQSAPQDIPGTTPETSPHAIIYDFPSGRPICNLKLPEVLDKSEALDKYTDRNSMLYTYHQMRRDEQISISSLANWEQVLREARE